MVHKKAIVFTDNEYLFKNFIDLVSKKRILRKFHFCKSESSKFSDERLISLDIKKNIQYVIDNYDIAFSLHSKQVFPAEIINKIRCINIHPGYNPFNRGWYPQVFSIIEDNIAGATIHLMDIEVDNGFIIVRKEVEKFIWDTSETLYNRIVETEINLMDKYLLDIMNDNYCPYPPEISGEIKSRSDFNKLCKIDLDKVGSFKDFYNYLRGISHGQFKNAYFIDNETGKKIYLKLVIAVDENL
jgi:methionyl-tRNA formyltransferase